MNSKGMNKATFVAKFSVSVLSLAISNLVYGQGEGPVVAPPIMEEMQVYGRLQTSAEALVTERVEQAVATDYIGAEQIGRIGDSTVAQALVRVPGVTLIENKFVFVRGLGERYSSTTLNGAMVPSPDLSRSVLPLDIFPTSIVESLAVQKVASADKPASFGGGSVDIRTKGIPDAFLFSVELGTGTNTSSSEHLTYDGGSDDRLGSDDGTRSMSSTLRSALRAYNGDVNARNIRNTDDLASMDEGRARNRELALELFRDVTIYEESGEPDIDAEVNLGNVFYLPNQMEFGFLAGGSYGSGWRSYEIVERRIGNPQELVSFEDESVFSVDMSANLSLGLNLNSENSITTTSLFLRNTDDEVSVRDYFTSNLLLSDGLGLRSSDIRYEQRELIVNQVHGEHSLGDETLGGLGLEETLAALKGLSFSWYASDSTATTDLPSEYNAKSDIVADPQTGDAISSKLAGADTSAITSRFSDLEDDVTSAGFRLSMPFTISDFELALAGGADVWDKNRRYEQIEFYLGSRSLNANHPLFAEPIGEIISDENLTNPDLGFQLRNSRDNVNSYLANNQVDALFGSIDVTWDYKLRLVLGSRWEEYQQEYTPWNPIDFSGNGLGQADTYATDDVYNSAALTWMLPGLWAEDFQIRASFAQTAVRPDLREIARSSYRDPITDISVQGNPNVVPSQIDNYDLRTEWFFSNGDNLTLSLFYKDITNPIELFEGAAADDNVVAEVHNADSAEVAGVEIEFLKGLGDVAAFMDPFFIQGNFTLLDHELIAGDRADAPTNPVRPLHGASDNVVNLILGFDSPDGQHAATLSFNRFSERLFFAGRNGAPDSYEQPFNSLDLTYSWYPQDTLTFKFKLRNLLDEDISIERTNRLADGTEQDVEIYHQPRGQDISLSVQYDF